MSISSSGPKANRIARKIQSASTPRSPAQEILGCPRAVAKPLEDDLAVELDSAIRAEANPPCYRYRPSSLAGTITTPWTHSRREQEIKRAVAALSQYDDQTLSDLGIYRRADIEWVVRYCHDC